MGTKTTKKTRQRKLAALPVVLTFEELEAMRSQTKTYPDQMCIDLMYYFGLRVGEMCALQKEMFDFKKYMLTLPAEICKRGRERRIPIPQVFELDLMRFHKTIKDGERLIPFTTGCIWRRIKRWAKDAGITKNIHPHVLRHTYCSHLYNKSKDLLLVKDCAGHVNIASTLIYTHLDDQHKKDGIKGAFE